MTTATGLGRADLHLFNEGTHYRLYEKLGAHLVEGGARFAVWAPGAERVHAIGDFSGWDPSAHPLSPVESSGLWAGFVPGAVRGQRYKYRIEGHQGHQVDKADPLATYAEMPPGTASVLWPLDHVWGDGEWMANRGARNGLDRPMSIYEVHLGSWRRGSSYRELARDLVEYLRRTNFTHVEFLPVMEHPFGGSWGYQATGFFAPTSRFGTPQDFMSLVDALHRAGLGVILDWVGAHFPDDEHGLAYFDGTHLYEHADPRQGRHPDWGTLVFNYGRDEVRSFLLSSALSWLDRYHADGLRVDAVASMLYLDYSRRPGEWIPNRHGGRENLEAIDFLRRLNEVAHAEYPDSLLIAEESTAWPMVSRPTFLGGLGFDLKWDMGWMHDTLRYLAMDPVHRKFHHDALTFRGLYAFRENFVLPLSHDEVVHGKGSLAGKMPGDEWRRFAHLRLLLAHQHAVPGKKLLFMGGEFGQRAEWNHDQSLDWEALADPRHAGVLALLANLNRLHRDLPALHELDTSPEGFEWIDASDGAQSVVSWIRRARSTPEVVLCVLNFTPVPRFNYRVGVPHPGRWEEVLNSDAREFGGSGHGNLGGVESAPIPRHGRRHSVNLTLPPLGALFLKSAQAR